ncbi:actin i [Stylonychia lemnae]|uniref:Actin i n=1 Tax=Stylonychia lemnae TaxID=5949 RepID=A0A078AHI1_STYLE|nr:actin i [Stylonychia lemnae]|eukprot:CDW80293.1 actin i [Stylonychia lemnae]
MDRSAIILDLGSESTKAGFSGDVDPKVVIPTIAGEHRVKDAQVGQGGFNRILIGDECISKRGLLNIFNVVQQGVIKDFTRIEPFLQHCFNNELRVASEEYNVIMSEVPFQSPADREKMAQLMFETFNVSGFYLGNQGLFSVYGSGRQSGVFCESGASVTHTIPVSDGVVISSAIQRAEFGGKDIDELMIQLLNEKGYSFTTTEEREKVRYLKEKHCIVAQDYESALEDNEERCYETPDGQYINLTNEIYKGGEAIFKTNDLCGRGIDSIQDMIMKSIDGSDEGVRASLFGAIVLSGGNTLFGGIRDRLQKEIESRAGDPGVVRVIADDSRKYNVFNGASVISSSSMIEPMWIQRDEYAESGASIVQTKCPQ